MLNSISCAQKNKTNFGAVGITPKNTSKDIMKGINFIKKHLGHQADNFTIYANRKPDDASILLEAKDAGKRAALEKGVIETAKSVLKKDVDIHTYKGPLETQEKLYIQLRSKRLNTTM